MPARDLLAHGTPVPRIVVLGWGNTSRADDALGPLLLAELAAADWPGVQTIEDFQLQIEHALDLDQADLVLFLDAGMGTPAPYTFYEARPAGRYTASTHALPPEAVLAVYRQALGRAPPPAFVLCVRGDCFDLGAPMSAAGHAHQAQARALLHTLFTHPSAEAWRRHCRAAAVPGPCPGPAVAVP